MMEQVEAADEALVVSLLAAAQVASKIDQLEECLLAARAALKNEEIILNMLYADQADYELTTILQNDITWKTALLDSIPLGPSPDQLRAITVLLKTRPFLGHANVS